VRTACRCRALHGLIERSGNLVYTTCYAQESSDEDYYTKPVSHFFAGSTTAIARAAAANAAGTAGTGYRRGDIVAAQVDAWRSLDEETGEPDDSARCLKGIVCSDCVHGYYFIKVSCTAAVLVANGPRVCACCCFIVTVGLLLYSASEALTLCLSMLYAAYVLALNRTLMRVVVTSKQRCTTVRYVQHALSEQSITA
jgi:hypothetical protein